MEGRKWDWELGPGIAGGYYIWVFFLGVFLILFVHSGDENIQ